MNRIFAWMGKAIISGIASFVIISVFCHFYYNLPVHYETKSGASDYSWEKGVTTSRGTEGFAMTVVDENGYVNTYPQKSDSVDILVMGSSHTEGFNVGEKENFVYVLNKLLDESNSGMYAYNIGVSGHTLDRCLKNLENAIDEFGPSKYIVIETAAVDRSLEFIKKLNNGTMESLESESSGIKLMFQKIPFLRLAYAQYANSKGEQEVTKKAYFDDEYIYELNVMLKNAGDIVQKHGCKLVIVYNTELGFDYNGDIIPQSGQSKIETFGQICKNNGIEFINMHPAFSKMYSETKHLPRGFSNTNPGEGHTNKYGHEAIAIELFNHICGGVEE